MRRYLFHQYHRIRAHLYRQSMPGLHNIPIAVILKFVWKEILRDDIMTRSNSMAFSFFLSIFPSLLVILTLLPYLPVDNLVAAFQHSYVDLLPKEMAAYMDAIINEMTTPGRGGLLSLSVILAIYFASNGVNTMIKGFHKSYEMTYKKVNLWQRQLKAVNLTLILGVLILGSLLAIVVGKPLLTRILTSMHLDRTIVAFYAWLRWLLVFLLYYFCIAIIYRVGPAFKNKLRIFTPGANLATVLSVISSIGFAIYVDNFQRYNQIYGSIGALILILLWLQINSFIILIGYEL
ncbi:MAG TPA: YihY/virulence factor BrkB family protein, partial [Saprospiraceae bacterium]|nr:YihY/virulence factor BrkB family protein [Saprospiraceae bacterium]